MYDRIELSIIQIGFLTREMNLTAEKVRELESSDKSKISLICADIITEEVTLQESDDERFNPDRLDMAELIIEDLM